MIVGTSVIHWATDNNICTNCDT